MHSLINRLTHSLTFSPADVTREFQVWPEQLDRSSLAGRFLHATLGPNPSAWGCSTWIEASLYQRAYQMSANVLAHHWHAKPLGHYMERARCNVTIHFEDPLFGHPCHTRVDCVSDNTLFLMLAHADEHPPDLQAYMAYLGWRRFIGEIAARTTRVVTFTVGEQPPHVVQVEEFDPTRLAAGQQQFDSAIRALESGKQVHYVSGATSWHPTQYKP